MPFSSSSQRAALVFVPVISEFHPSVSSLIGSPGADVRLHFVQLPGSSVHLFNSGLMIILRKASGVSLVHQHAFEMRVSVPNVSWTDLPALLRM